MKKLSVIAILLTAVVTSVIAQSDTNCFLIDFEPKKAVVPEYIDAVKPDKPADVAVTIAMTDTIGKISKYIFGNALAVWIGNDPIYDNVFVNQVKKLAPTLIRYPGGSWSDIFFWNGIAKNVPPTVWDGTQNKWVEFTPQLGKNSWPTTIDNYYRLREEVSTQGLITINYGYARYGTGDDPVAEAAHLAADWVRYDAGRTKFWEIGNENGGPWEAGWKIDTALNKDGQPEIISGELYGKHFKIFVDSMKAAAAEIGTEIYIGGQILHFDGTNSWNPVDRTWNAGFFKEGAEAADFYVIHNYFGQTKNAKSLLDVASSEVKKNIEFILKDIPAKNAPFKPVALTEYNMNSAGGEPDLPKTSIINGMQSVILFNELIKYNFGMSARWLLANWESDGMFYRGNNKSIQAWNPRPDFYYIYFLKKFVGDHSIKNEVKGNSQVLAYSSSFGSGHIGVVIVNKSTAAQTVKIYPAEYGVGNKYYVYSLTGGTDNGEFSQYVYVNGEYGPTDKAQGPLAVLDDIPAMAYEVEDEIKVESPARSVQFILIEPGNKIVSVDDPAPLNHEFQLYQNFPNPFNPTTTISFSLPGNETVSLKVYDILGREIASILNNENLAAGYHEYSFDGENLSSGVYIYSLHTGEKILNGKMTLIK
ncbi:alpha-L-arabinofuranosidase-like protein [Melioribacter roseus P3M-2]|uniref:Alpha-L-arabinofuranosidase-like protein n=1 Tax=Melioribacter roseus (strain DSM 23840 / JCM 17771 / VKM B-2668 / P3M-2) TaxID=1191523 RepID=I6Z6U4_MELRP|nr:T9SS type A sorting domain-containing protein [Melioribacter roseus]AFN74880.1 alpha-L-arabinofuranosidase-like protein [Melioribacter roseus P3M-2]